MTKRLAWQATGVCIGALAVVGSFSLARMIADREPPIVYYEARALDREVEQGGTITVEFTVERNRRCPIDVRRILTDAEGERHTIPTVTVGPASPLGIDVYERRVTVPPKVATGPAEYDVRLRYACNPIQEALGWPIEVEAPTIYFDVVERPSGFAP